MAGYAKLFSSITESSLWGTGKEVRLLFVSMLARCDAVGFVESSVSGLCRLANLTPEEVERSLKELESPDPDSKDPDNEGRRIEKVPGGWILLNYEKYRERRSEEDRRDYMREYMRQKRQGTPVNSVNNLLTSVNNVSRSKPPLAQAEATATATATAKKTITASAAKKPATGGGLNPWGLWMDVCRSRSLPAPAKAKADLAAASAMRDLCEGDKEKMTYVLREYLKDQDRFLIGQGHALRLLPQRVNKYFLEYSKYQQRIEADRLDREQKAQWARDAEANKDQEPFDMNACLQGILDDAKNGPDKSEAKPGPTGGRVGQGRNQPDGE